MCDQTERIMQAEPLTKILGYSKLTRPVRNERCLRECCPREGENCPIVDSVANDMILYHVIRIFLVDDPVHSAQPGSQPAYVIALGQAPAKIGCSLGPMSDSVARIPCRILQSKKCATCFNPL